SLGSGSWRNALNFQENTIRYLRFQASLMNKAGSKAMAPHGGLGEIYRGVTPFIVADLLRLALLIVFPALSLWML
ncbi:MAG: hypothetical protein ABN479_04320, partial [Billgrantia sp.]